MSDMFDSCSKLTSLDLSNFNTSNVTNMYGMFHNCTSLVSLDLSNFDTSKVTNMVHMFDGCSKLNRIILNNTNPPSINEILPKLPTSANLYVPSESVEVYKTQWSNYSDRIFAIE